MFLQWNPIVVLGFQVSIQRFSIFSDNGQINMFLQVSIEILCIAFLLFRLAQEFLFSVKGAFWRCPRKPPELLFWVLLFTTRDAKHVVQLTVLVLMFLDIAIYTGLYESDVSSVRFLNWKSNPHLSSKLFFWHSTKIKIPTRWSRPLRPLLLVNIPEGRQIRRAFRNIRRYRTSFLSWSRWQEMSFTDKENLERERS